MGVRKIPFHWAQESTYGGRGSTPRLPRAKSERDYLNLPERPKTPKFLPRSKRALLRAILLRRI